MNNRSFGSTGEYDVHDYLIGQGYAIRAMNYRKGPGEIDVIAEKGGTIAFIEVKRRSSLRYGRPAEAVDRKKQAHILRTAQLYLQENHLRDVPLRFDVIEVLTESAASLKVVEINHIVCAYEAGNLSGAF